MEEIFQKAVKELKLCGIRVLLFCMSNKDKIFWRPINFSQWSGLGAKQGHRVWEDGIADLVVNGFLGKNEKGELIFLKPKKKEEK